MIGFRPQEMVLLFIVASFWLIPIGAAIWAIVTLKQIRSAQKATLRQLDNIEQLLGHSAGDSLG